MGLSFMRQRPTPLQHAHSHSCAYAHEFVCMLACAQPVFQVSYCYSQSYLIHTANNEENTMYGRTSHTP